MDENFDNLVEPTESELNEIDKIILRSHKNFHSSKPRSASNSDEGEEMTIHAMDGPCFPSTRIVVKERGQIDVDNIRSEFFPAYTIRAVRILSGSPLKVQPCPALQLHSCRMFRHWGAHRFLFVQLNSLRSDDERFKVLNSTLFFDGSVFRYLHGKQGSEHVFFFAETVGSIQRNSFGSPLTNCCVQPFGFIRVEDVRMWHIPLDHSMNPGLSRCHFKFSARMDLAFSNAIPTVRVECVGAALGVRAHESALTPVTTSCNFEDIFAYPKVLPVAVPSNLEVFHANAVGAPILGRTLGGAVGCCIMT